MASSNRHWPSMFKSKPHHLQHDINSSSSLMSNACRLSPISSVGEERSPEPKPRWNPKPEQIRILEAIFNSGMVNPPRDEIRKIRAQLQEYGQVGDANVFYWFQNRKSRSKHKQRHLQNSKQNPPAATAHDTAAAIAPSSSSSLSSGKSFTNGSDSKTFNIISPTDATSNVIDVSHSPTDSVNQTYFQSPNEYLQDPFFFPAQQQNIGGASVQGLCFNGLINNGVHQIVDNQTVGNFSTLFLGEMIGSGSRQEEEERLKFQQQLSFFVANPSPATIAPTSAVIVPSLPPLQGAGQLAGSKSTVLINDVAFEAPVGPFNVREAFGDDCMLVTPSGYPVLTDEWGVTLHPLQSGASYYLMRTLAAPPFDRRDTTASDLLAPEFPYQI